jgi:hypothetical protein
LLQRNHNLAVRGEPSSQSPDPPAQVNKLAEVTGDIPARSLGDDLGVQLFELRLDRLESTKVARDYPLANGRDKGRGIELADLTSALSSLEKLL